MATKAARALPVRSGARCSAQSSCGHWHPLAILSKVVRVEPAGVRWLGPGPYFKMRRTCYNKTDWVNVRLRGGVLTHPFQQDGSSCGVMVIMMAKAVMEAFPNKPEMTFLRTKKEMAQARRTFAQTILEASVFDSDNNCAMCATEKPPNPGPSITDWV
ncbi:unnamed protein product [Oreochromis niloticus]|nr:unnamed protein product [Mustela putorius furo]